MRILTLVCLISVVCLTSLTAYAASNKSASVITSRIAVSDTSFNHPHDLVRSPDGTKLYVSDLDNNVVKVTDPTTLKTMGPSARTIWIALMMCLSIIKGVSWSPTAAMIKLSFMRF